MQLIINADDAGVDCSRNRGIFKAVDYGLVTSTTVIIQQRGWEDVIKSIKERPSLGAGFHFNITEGKPLVQNHKSLTDESGCFFKKDQLYSRAMQGMIDSREVAGELDAQLAVFKDSIKEPSHVDSHHHVHLLPGIREAVIAVIPKGAWVRIPHENKSKSLRPSIEQCATLYDNANRLVGALNYFSKEAKRLWGDYFSYTDDFCGTRIGFQPTLKMYKREISKLKGSVCELMCHPGAEPDEDSVNFSKSKQRKRERNNLTSDELKTFIAKRNIELVSYNEVVR